VKENTAPKSSLQSTEIILSGYLNCPKRRKMGRDELRIQEQKTSHLEMRDQINQRNLRGVRYPMKHRLTEESSGK
jgi:hypothetical protein